MTRTTFIATEADVKVTLFEPMTDDERVAYARTMARKTSSPIRVEVTRIVAVVEAGS